jgi:signal transduction histidine kinase
MEEKIIQAIIIITSIFILVGIFVIAYLIYFNKRKTKLIEENTSMKESFQQQLLQSQVEIQEQTFQHIGKELHDNVGQLLSSSKMLLGLTEMNLENPPDTLQTANATLGQAINELRNLSKSLDKEWLEQFNLNENLQAEIARINTGGKVYAIYHQQNDIPINPNEQIILFRIVQEAIQNAIKHARPKNIEIASSKTEADFIVSITDDGKGFEMNDKGSGMGLKNMKYRTLLLGGFVTWDVQPGRGTTVIITLPLKGNIQ